MSATRFTLRHKISQTLALHKIATKKNRLFHKEYIPNPQEHLYIEPSNICNLRCKICPNRKLSDKKIVMDNQFFFDVVDQAADFGYDTFGLTPNTGEVFTDRDFLIKLDYLENHPKVAGYSFFTNFTLPDKSAINRLLGMRKLKNLNVSVYGHDRESFTAITQSNDRTYDALLNNLKLLSDSMDIWTFNLNLSQRIYSSISSLQEYGGDLLSLLSMLRRAPGCTIGVHQSYSNWGGYIDQSDVLGLDIEIRDGTTILKNGACNMLFYKNIVLVDGRVNACACMDAGGTLIIGDLKTQSLQEIYSTKNEVYMELIEEQQQGCFRPVCKTCDYYQGIYEHKLSPRLSKRPITLKQFHEMLEH